MTGHIKIFGQFAKMKFGLVRRDLFQKPVDQLSSHDPGKSRDIINGLIWIKDGTLAARTIQRVYQITFEAEKPKLENGKKRNRPGTDNGYPGLPSGLHYALLNRAAQPARSVLAFGHLNDKPLQIVGNADLAGKARGRADFIGEIQHILFHWIRPADRIGPVVIDIDMAGCAGASATAFGINTGNAVANGRFHNAGPVVGLDLGSRGAIGGYEYNLRHFYSLRHVFDAIFVLRAPGPILRLIARLIPKWQIRPYEWSFNHRKWRLPDCANMPPPCQNRQNGTPEPIPPCRRGKKRHIIGS
ncbi:Hypothetical protein BSSP1_I0677 [Brucella suis bv. 2]|nr:Hypothetical protein BSPT1_I0689 [Brucella suis bv. 2]AIB24145.1 Hypothetical protein BSPT2_I0676 [Brucella suis bv. 2]AIB27539.1 Hypothetical protein BSSP1_I0677 [Brucella suis bv. 2]